MGNATARLRDGAPCFGAIPNLKTVIGASFLCQATIESERASGASSKR